MPMQYQSIHKYFLCIRRYCNENHGQRKRYKRHIANVWITPVIAIEK